MDQIDRKLQRRAAIAAKDPRQPSPEERASVVWSLLRENFPDLTDWDLLCFAVEYMGSMSIQWPWLENVAKAAVSLVYTAHYEAMTDEATATGLKHASNRGSENRPDGSTQDSNRSDASSGGHGDSFSYTSPSLHIRSVR